MPTSTYPLLLQAVGDKKAAASKDPLGSSISEFYMTDAISRASKVMAKCVRAKQEAAQGQRSQQASVGI